VLLNIRPTACVTGRRAPRVATRASPFLLAPRACARLARGRVAADVETRAALAATWPSGRTGIGVREPCAAWSPRRRHSVGGADPTRSPRSAVGFSATAAGRCFGAGGVR
jgi:hypothetical protein